MGCIQEPDHSSSFPVQKSGSLEAGELGNCDEIETITTQESFLTRHPREDNSKRNDDELPPIEKASQNGCDPQKNSHACESSGNERDNCSDKNISLPVELDARNDFNLVNSKLSITRELSSSCDNESPVLDKLVEEFTESPSKNNFKNPSEHKITQNKLTKPLITYRCYKRKKCTDGTDRQSILLREKEKISVLTRWSMLANANPSCSDESSCEECPVDNVPDLNQSVELSERVKPLNQTQDETSCRNCSVVFLTDLNHSAELSEGGELYQTQEKVWFPGDSLKTCDLLHKIIVDK